MWLGQNSKISKIDRNKFITLTMAWQLLSYYKKRWLTKNVPVSLAVLIVQD